ncbi:MAG TPA: zinc-binding dehydrogenase, partial [Acidimicrobiales bacterium]|nr:zinc-binding dehydrogenase [Acidimicrobiales bacterium]
RYAASRVISALGGSGRGAAVGPLRLVDVDTPELPGPDWYFIVPSLAGICGSDLSTIDGRSSRYFEDLVSFPFIPGHEVVGTVKGSNVEESGDLSEGDRVVIEPVLGCIPRGIVPPCSSCTEGRTGGCERVAFGHLRPGLQIGFCRDTGGGWSTAGLVAHRSQLHLVPDDLDDESAVLVEPTACAVHATLAAGIEPGMTVAILGAGTLGLATIAAVRHLTSPATLLAGAKHELQRELAAELGADVVVTPQQLPRAVRRQSRSLNASGHLTGGADVVIDCVGSGESIADALSMVRPRGRVVLLGMPGRVHVDLSSLWHREVQLVGAYAYGTEVIDGRPTSTFDIAMDVVRSRRLGRLVSARYPLERFEEAISHAGEAGRRGAVKIVFDLNRAARPPLDRSDSDRSDSDRSDSDRSDSDRSDRSDRSSKSSSKGSSE